MNGINCEAEKSKFIKALDGHEWNAPDSLTEVLHLLPEPDFLLMMKRRIMRLYLPAPEWMVVITVCLHMTTELTSIMLSLAGWMLTGCFSSVILFLMFCHMGWQ
ncbi:MAG: hypothetical protein FWE06_05465 [Oscillospiraceae bacterium]|nr:hypothetical protein [Oscillospiraceae bacterium]